MKLLLDTHVLIWSIFSSRSLTHVAASVIRNDLNEVFVSAVTAWEIATKVRLGKLPEAAALERDFTHAIELAGYDLLPIKVETALRAGRLVGAHRDPFDRMLAAQALEDDIPIVSADPKLDSFLVRRIW